MLIQKKQKSIYSQKTNAGGDMILLASFTNEMEAQLLASKLKASGIDHKLKDDKSDGYNLFVFEDDLEEAREIFHAASGEDEFGFDLNEDEDINLDEFEG